MTCGIFAGKWDSQGNQVRIHLYIVDLFNSSQYHHALTTGAPLTILGHVFGGGTPAMI